ncbi:MAG TPA: hypothetical protein VM387_12975 [Gemmatimonadales bacterium]|nr:hypothetical protein [Gemmatimonadales bacterium]
MSSSNRPLAAAALAAVLGVPIVTIAAAAQEPAAGRETTAAAQAIAVAPAETAYLLLDLGGKPLPARIETEWRCYEDVVAGTLRLREDGRWRLETTVRETCGSRSKMEQEDEDGIYRTEASTLRFLDDDGHRNGADRSLDDEIDLDDLDHGTLAEGGVLTVRLADGKTVLRFRREGT